MVKKDIKLQEKPQTKPKPMHHKHMWIWMIIGLLLVVAGIVLAIIGAIFFTWLRIILGLVLIALGIVVLYFLRERIQPKEIAPSQTTQKVS
jgi:cytochrome c biogenesis protein CcdA